MGWGARLKVSMSSGGGWRGRAPREGPLKVFPLAFKEGGGKEGEGDAVQLSCGQHRALVGPICAV